MLTKDSTVAAVTKPILFVVRDCMLWALIAEACCTTCFSEIIGSF